jgi:hypothetical protein
MSRNRGFLGRRRAHYIVEPREEIPRTEHEETRRLARDWLRERDEDNAAEWDEGEQEIFV